MIDLEEPNSRLKKYIEVVEAGSIQGALNSLENRVTEIAEDGGKLTDKNIVVDGLEQQRQEATSDTQPSGLANIMYDVIYCRTESSISRMHHRFLNKKRQWLLR